MSSGRRAPAPSPPGACAVPLLPLLPSPVFDAAATAADKAEEEAAAPSPAPPSVVARKSSRDPSFFSATGAVTPPRCARDSMAPYEDSRASAAEERARFLSPSAASLAEEAGARGGVERGVGSGPGPDLDDLLQRLEGPLVPRGVGARRPSRGCAGSPRGLPRAGSARGGLCFFSGLGVGMERSERVLSRRFSFSSGIPRSLASPTSSSVLLLLTFRVIVVVLEVCVLSVDLLVRVLEAVICFCGVREWREERRTVRERERR